MTTLFAHMTVHGEPDYDSDLMSDHQPVPVRIEAVAGDQSVSCLIRPDGWPMDKDLKATLSRTGVRTVGPLAILCDLIDVADLLVVHDFQRLDWCMKRWRTLVGRRPEWLRKIEVFDTARQATSICKLPVINGLDLPDVYRTPTLAEATAQLCGKAMTGAAGVTALYEALRAKERKSA